MLFRSESLPWVKIFSHGFQGPGGWFIDNCLTTKNQQCPVCEHNTQLWNSGIEANKNVARNQKRKLNYISNVYVVSDPKHPENEGKVFLFRYGKKIFDKIIEAMNPQFEDEEALNPFDMWKGANFKLKIRKVDGYQNYDKSEFESSEALDEDDSKLEKIWKSQYSLQELISDKEFKSYEANKDRLDKVLGLSGQTPSVTKSLDEAPKKAKTVADEDPPFEPDLPNLDEEDDMSYFSKLAED